MLCLTRRAGESFYIDIAGVRAEIVIQKAVHGRAKVGIKAPQEAKVTRKELENE